MIFMSELENLCCEIADELNISLHLEDLRPASFTRYGKYLGRFPNSAIAKKFKERYGKNSWQVSKNVIKDNIGILSLEGVKELTYQIFCLK